MAVSKKRLILYASSLVAGFTISPYTFIDFPAFWIRYGMTGFITWLVFSLVLLGLATFYVEAGQKRGQKRGNFMDIYTKRIRGFGFLAVISLILIIQAGFWSGVVGRNLMNTMKFPMGFAEVVKAVILLGFFIALIRGREKNFYIIMISAFISLFMAMTLTTYGQNLNGQYTDEAVKLLFQFKPFTTEMGIEALIMSVLTLGMGAFFYYLLGNFIPTPEIKARTILTLGFVGGIIASILAGVGYALTFGVNAETYQVISAYASGQMPKAEFIHEGIHAITESGYIGFMLILIVALIFSTATRVLPTLEIALVVVRRFIKGTRPELAKIVLGLAFILTVADFNLGYHIFLKQLIVAMFFFGALFETIGIIVTETGFRKLIATESGVLFLSLGIYKLVGLYSANMPALIVSLVLISIALWLNLAYTPSGVIRVVRGRA